MPSRNPGAFREEYGRKLVSVERIALLVKFNKWVQLGEFVCQPRACDAALAGRKDQLQDVKLRVVTMSWTPEVCKVDPQVTPPNPVTARDAGRAGRGRVPCAVRLEPSE